MRIGLYIKSLWSNGSVRFGIVVIVLTAAGLFFRVYSDLKEVWEFLLVVGEFAIAWVIYHEVGEARRQLKADHERSRRELTLTLMHQWNTSISAVTAVAEKIVKRLSDEQCRKLANFQSFGLAPEHRQLLENCLADLLPKDPLTEHGGQIVLSINQVTRLRFLAVEYLNQTETVLMGWHMSVVDREVIENEFQFLFDDKIGDDALAKFRTAMGGKEAFPALHEFGKMIGERKQQEGAQPRSEVA